MGGQSNQRHAEDTNKSSRREAALLISILHAGKSCQLSLRQTAAAFHTRLCTTWSGPPLHTAQSGCVLRLTILWFISRCPRWRVKRSLLTEDISHHVALVQVLSSNKPNNNHIVPLSVEKPLASIEIQNINFRAVEDCNSCPSLQQVIILWLSDWLSISSNNLITVKLLLDFTWNWNDGNPFLHRVE